MISTSVCTLDNGIIGDAPSFLTGRLLHCRSRRGTWRFEFGPIILVVAKLWSGSRSKLCGKLARLNEDAWKQRSSRRCSRRLQVDPLRPGTDSPDPRTGRYSRRRCSRDDYGFAEIG